jgi:hypothetical protein
MRCRVYDMRIATTSPETKVKAATTLQELTLSPTAR